MGLFESVECVRFIVCRIRCRLENILVIFSFYFYFVISGSHILTLPYSYRLISKTQS